MLADITLTGARITFSNASETAIRSFLSVVLKRAIRATTFGNLLDILDEVLQDDLSKRTLIFILDNRADFISFLCDLIDPCKRYVTGASVNGVPVNSVERPDEFNEFNLSDPMNRHAFVCQVQRVLKSIACLLQRQIAPEEFMMNTELESDFSLVNGERISVIPAIYTTNAPPEGNSVVNNNESWLFVNGIAGEYYWLKLYCDRLQRRFRRSVTGVHNRGDGILWDLVECVGERDPIRRTKSSIAAENRLRDELRTKLGELHAKVTPNTAQQWVVMIAYSQGCLLLRNVLRRLADPQDDFFAEDQKRIAREHLRVFTFGNPSADWHADDGTGLHDYVNHTEHFANRLDFVSRLGVVEFGREGYDEGPTSHIFINCRREWVGHLFGTQYSFDRSHYTNQNNRPSKLLACLEGTPMQQ
jgi:hypothetical protein